MSVKSLNRLSTVTSLLGYSIVFSFIIVFSYIFFTPLPIYIFIKIFFIFLIVFLVLSFMIHKRKRVYSKELLKKIWKFHLINSLIISIYIIYRVCAIVGVKLISTMYGLNDTMCYVALEVSCFIELIISLFCSFSNIKLLGEILYRRKELENET